MIAVCGLECANCDIRSASENVETAKHIARWFKSELGEDVKPDQIRCGGCRGDRTEHWSPDCAILKCCVDDKGLEDCTYCSDFPCAMLVEWAESGDKYRTALDRLKMLKLNR